MNEMIEQPITTEIKIADGIFMKTMCIHKAGTMVPQHSHTYAHLSALVKGSVRLWKDGMLDGDYRAPTGILVTAKVKHLFQALEDDTKVVCIHDIGVADMVSIAEEHIIAGEV